MNEFEIIERYFKPAAPASDGNLVLGIGDDAAIVNVPGDSELLFSMDTLTAATHFPADTPPGDIAYKSLAVNLSDMAAMGALPRWVSLSLTVPGNDADWLEKFSSSFHRLAGEHSLLLAGGDISRGPLSITIQVHGFAPRGKSLRRRGAGIGDSIYVSGYLGAAAYVLEHLKDRHSFSPPTAEERQRFYRPDARIKLGIELRNVATSCIDISDGLFSDLGHILEAGRVGAEIKLAAIPYSESLHRLEIDTAIKLALTGGDDYELCFTLPGAVLETTLDALCAICPIHWIGRINNKTSDLTLIDDNEKEYNLTAVAYRHFE